MVAYSQTVRNRLNVFDDATVSLWGTLQWGGKWGYTANGAVYSIRKALANTATVSSTVAKQVRHPLTAETVTLTDAFTKQYGKILSAATITVSGDLVEEKITDRNGYEFVYGDSSDAEDRSLTAYSSATVNDATWTTAAGVTTIWA